MPRRTASKFLSLSLAVLMTLGMLGGVDRLAGAERRIGAEQVAMIAQATSQASHDA
jgi:hypothetical protein